MRTRLIALVPAAVTFAAAEAVCRLLLNLSDQVVPLVVFPLTFFVWGLTTTYIRAGEARTRDED